MTEKAAPNLLPLPQALWEHHAQILRDVLAQWVELKRIPPVLLLTGPSGIGKRGVAYTIAQWVLCERAPFGRRMESTLDLFPAEGAEGTSAPARDTPPKLEPCGECAACHKALSGHWVDFQEIRSDEEGGTLKIDQFRDLKASAGFGAHEGAYRIFLISDAERMTPQAANSMLKILEEPPEGWLFLLTAADATLLLPTLVSRCQRLRLKPLPTPLIESLLGEMGSASGERARVCAQLAQGSLSQARSLAEEENWEQRKNLFRFLESPAEHLSGWVDWATADPDHFALLLNQLEQALDDLIRSAAAPGHAWLNSDGAKSLAEHSRKASQHFGSLARTRGFWLDRAERLARVRQEALAPLNRKILLQDLLSPWLEIR